MDSPDGGPERRPSTWRQSVASDFDGHCPGENAVADGFRPHQATAPQPPRTSTETLQRPSSISKPPQAHDSLTLRNDGTSRRHPEMPASPNAGAFILPDGSYQGLTGPSHPYSMYPQEALDEAASSTAPNVAHTAPAHPYALYTQTIGDDDAAVRQIAYQRQTSAGGDETGDLLGALAPVEELPPYTRYPEGPSARPPREAAPDAMRAVPPIAISGAGGLGRATRDPEFSSAEDELPTASTSHPVTPGETASQHEINTAARDFSEKTAPLTTWQRRAKKKLWGIVPCWAIALLVVGILIVGVVLGTVIGTVLSKRAKADGHGDSQAEGVSRSPSSDIEPLRVVPASLPPLVTGAFCLPPLDISQAPRSCFNDPRQAQAWSCEMPFRFYAMAISRDTDAPATRGYTLSLTARNASDSKFLWGTQPPDITSPQRLTLVDDTFERNRGPAWWMLTKFNKTVVIDEDKISRRLSKRDGPPVLRPKTIAKRRGAELGDKPWICTWPDTTLEIFIYPSQSTSYAASPSGADAAMSDFMHDPMSSYPMVVKLLERRWCNNPQQPMVRCRQVEIIAEGTERSLEDENGNPIEVIIDESWRSAEERVAQRERERHPGASQAAYNDIYAREALELTDCGCLWLST
ncbi:hypothetical protein L249_8513 [Ophiocordyceps polyrhachis-furcata BCC 54312]|uniref:DUF7820 domain-containing protein n=1 Tax=Ophiocordyceps polyrhachis-furcata BCC 54312 TaxID=1330021 RepID=A0A367L722_9HYPO|nr:hypothetical protein L249_8513 [Ophiocordyceps polyrhachis-furcata BCC 54312]